MSRFQSEMTSWAPILAKMACLSSIREAEQSSTRMDFSWSVFLALLVGGGKPHLFQNKLWTGSLKRTPENLGYNNWLQDITGFLLTHHRSIPIAALPRIFSNAEGEWIIICCSKSLASACTNSATHQAREKIMKFRSMATTCRNPTHLFAR